MKHIFLIGVVAYAAASLLLNHWPNAVNYTGMQAAPWMGLMLVDALFAATAIFKMMGPALFEGAGEDDIHEDDVELPDTWFYGLFGLNILGNLGYHAYMFAIQTGPEAFGYSVWFMSEAIALVLTIVFFKLAQRKAIRQARAARSSLRSVN